MEFAKLNKLKRGDKVAIVSPSYAAPGRWPHVYEFALQRLREVFDLEPVEFPATKKLGASGEERASDLIAAFEDRQIKAVIASLGGDDQISYISSLPVEPFRENPKFFLGFSDNTHFSNFLWLQGIPSYYGASLFTQFAMQGRMDSFTVNYLRRVLFEVGEFELTSSDTYNDRGLEWGDPANLKKKRVYEENDGWYWDGASNVQGVAWGGCLESIEKLLLHSIHIPTLEDFEDIVLFTETSELIPNADCVFRVYQALGELGILQRIKGVLVGRPKAWEFDRPNTAGQKALYRQEQREAILTAVRIYNSYAPVIQNLDFGHTDPQFPVPNGRTIRIDSSAKRIFVDGSGTEIGLGRTT